MRKSSYKKALLSFSVFLVILAVVFLIYLYGILKDYERYQINNFLNSAINSLSDDELLGYLADNNKPKELLNEYKEFISNTKYEFKEVEENIYEATLNDRLFFTLQVESRESISKFGILNYELWEVKEIIPNLDRGLIYYDIIVPSNYNVYVNDEKLSGYQKSEKYENLDFMYYNDSMPTIVTYEVDDLVSEADIRVENFKGEEVKLNKDIFTYTLTEEVIKVDTFDEAKKYIGSNLDILELARNWSLFLTNDLKGTYHGFTTIKDSFIEGTDMYQNAYNWAHNVDILFTSRHTFSNPPFSNEKVSNFVIYDDSAFYCEVYLEKNMIVSRKEQKDIMHDYFYFIKDNNKWKLVNIKALNDSGENNE